MPEELDGAIITNNFWTFNANEEIIYPEYLEYFMPNEYFISVCNTCSYGSTNRWYLDEEAFNDFRIPLPSKSKQKEILDDIKIEKERIEKAKNVILESKANIRQILGELIRNEEDIEIYSPQR